VDRTGGIERLVQRQLVIRNMGTVSGGPELGLYMRRNSIIAAAVPPALLAPFYLWIGAIWMFVGRPPSVDYLPPWLARSDFVGVPLLFLILPGAFLILLICIVSLLFRGWRGPAAVFLLSSATVFVFLGWIDPGGWFHWFLD
jgi:hypothetical protein